MRYFLEIAYQGTHYHGWQMQPNATTIQGIVQEKLSQLLSTQIEIIGSSRTDTGVHAAQQWAHMDVPFEIDTTKLQYKLNLLLPADIAILGVYPVITVAHSRFDAISRTYIYKIVRSKNPFLPATTYLFRKDLDIDSMNAAAAILKSQENFESFSKVGSSTSYPYLCNIWEANWQVTANGQIVFRITANRFLRGMVRAIVGNLLEVGLRKMSITEFKYILEQKDRSLGASLVPACGLTLEKVIYPTTIFMKSNELTTE
jgi:tRNA pseudouridine38-40 synthase